MQHNVIASGECILQSQDLVMDFGRKRVLDGISMQLNRGE